MATLRVLVVEDDRVIGRLLYAVLGRGGYRVDLAESGRAALARLARRDDYGLILLDVMMPEMDGLTVLRKIRADPRHQTVPVILCTAMGDREVVRRAIELGCDSYVLKPFRPAELLQTVARVLADQTPVLRDAREITTALGIDLRGYQSRLRQLNEEIDQAVIVFERHAPGTAPGQLMRCLEALCGAAQELGAVRAEQALGRIVRLYTDDTQADHRPALAEVISELRRLQRALEAAA